MTLQKRYELPHRGIRGGGGVHASVRGFCDMCGKVRAVRSIEHFEGSIWLCRTCNDQINHLSHKLDDITELFIIGNAL